MSVSILILTRNEELNLQRCLDSVAWSDDILVLDSFSDDNTCEIARRNGTRVLQHAFEDFATQRNHGLEKGQLKYEWVLHLDADEVVSFELRSEILTIIQESRFNAFRIPSKMIFQDRWLKFAGMYPAYQVRLGRRDRLRFRMAGHGQRETLPSCEISTLSGAFLHYSFSKGLEDWFAKHNRYSSAEAKNNLAELAQAKINWRGICSKVPIERRRALKALSIRLRCRPLVRFLYMYVMRLGFLDGLHGYHYCRMLAIYEYMIVLKMDELRRSNKCAGG